ncbi:unnamed protein product [Arabidopsis halleri]
MWINRLNKGDEYLICIGSKVRRTQTIVLNLLQFWMIFFVVAKR